MKIRVLQESEPFPTDDTNVIGLYAPPSMSHTDETFVFCQACTNHIVVGPDFALVPTIPAGWGELDYEGPNGLAGRHYEYYCPDDVKWLPWFKETR